MAGFCSKYKEYIKICTSGVLAILVISSIYSFLANVETVQVIADVSLFQAWGSVDWETFDTNNGIACKKGLDFKDEYCKNVANIIASRLSLETVNPEWQCEAYTDFSTSPFFETFIFTFTSFRNYLIVLIIFTIIFGISAIIHDSSLVYYKTQIKFGFETPKIINRTSTIVGIARFIMAFSTAMMMLLMVDGFSREIPVGDEFGGDCTCECVYVFRESDYYKILIVTQLFVGVSINFLYSWMKEPIHGQHFLYLISYRLPVEQAHRINPDDCTGDMMIDLTTVNRNDVMKDDGKIMDMMLDKLEMEEKLENQNDAEQKESDDIKQPEEEFLDGFKKKFKYFKYRVMIVAIEVAYFFIVFAMMIFHCVYANYYHYSNTIIILAYVFSAILMLLGIIAAVYIIFSNVLKFYRKLQQWEEQEIEELAKMEQELEMQGIDPEGMQDDYNNNM